MIREEDHKTHDKALHRPINELQRIIIVYHPEGRPLNTRYAVHMASHSVNELLRSMIMWQKSYTHMFQSRSFKERQFVA